RLTMAVAARIGRTIFEIGDEAYQLLDGFLVSLPALLGGRQLRFPQNPGLTVAAGPGDQRGRSVAEQVDPVKRISLFVEADRTVVNQVLAHIVAVQVHIERSLQLASMGAAAGEFAL